MRQIKQLADIDTNKYFSARWPEVGIEAEVLDTDKVKMESIHNRTELGEVLKEVVGTKLIFIEPIIDDMEGNTISGLTFYFMQPDGNQRAIEIYSGDFDIDKLCIQFYSLNKAD